jgi:hypothetical protein
MNFKKNAASPYLKDIKAEKVNYFSQKLGKKFQENFEKLMFQLKQH